MTLSVCSRTAHSYTQYSSSKHDSGHGGGGGGPLFGLAHVQLHRRLSEHAKRLRADGTDDINCLIVSRQSCQDKSTTQVQIGQLALFRCFLGCCFSFCARCFSTSKTALLAITVNSSLRVGKVRKTMSVDIAVCSNSKPKGQGRRLASSRTEHNGNDRRKIAIKVAPAFMLLSVVFVRHCDGELPDEISDLPFSQRISSLAIQAWSANFLTERCSSRESDLPSF